VKWPDGYFVRFEDFNEVHYDVEQLCSELNVPLVRLIRGSNSALPGSPKGRRSRAKGAR